MIKKFLKMGLWRILGVGAGALGSIWAARMLGPEKLGISGMVSAYAVQASLFVTMGLNALLIREYKKSQERQVEQDQLVSQIVSYRLIVALAASVIWLVIALATGLPSNWWLATIMGILSVVTGALTTDWLLQAQENQVVQQRLTAIGGFVSAILMFAFIRKDTPAGGDLVVAFFVAMIVRSLTWTASVKNRHHVRISWSSMTAGLPLIWKGRWLFLSGLLIYCYVRLEIPMLGWLRSIDEVGLYRSALQIQGGIQPILALVPALLYPRMIEWGKVSRQHLWAKQLHLAKSLALLFIPVTIAIFLLVPWVYPYLFGAEFKAAATPCALLIVSKLMVVLNGIFGWGLWSMEKDLTMLVILGVVAILSVTLNLLLMPRYGMIAAASVNLASECLILLGCMYFQYRHCREEKSLT